MTRTATDRPALGVLFVCMGNICRSPTAEGVLRRKLRQAGLERHVLVDSAGTHGWHAGEPPDRRAIAHAARRGYDLAPLRARAVDDADFERFDLVLAMDWDNLAELESRCPPQHRAKLGRLAAWGRRHRADEVPDPYAHGPEAFEQVLDLVEDACTALVDDLAARVAGNFLSET
jgi:protein-tyrosine phosphatase